MHSGEIIAEGESNIILGNKDARKFYLETRLNINGGASRVRTTTSSLPATRSPK